MTKKNSKLIIEPKEFFRNLVSEAMANKNYPAQDEVEFYLVNLLCNFIEPTKIKTSHGDIDVLDTPLATLLKLALESDHEEQKVIFKALGDASLYISGYFQDYFNRKSFDPKYFMTLGSSAYLSLSSLSKQNEKVESFD